MAIPPFYWRLSGFYLFYFASLGALIPYWSLYLKSNGYDVDQIGEIIAILMGTKIIAPNIWGWIADHTGHRMRVIRLASLLSIVIFCAVFVRTDYWWMAMVMFGFSFFWNANLPQFEAATLNHLGKATQRYSAIRLWGSLGFILAVVVMGDVLEMQGADVLPVVVASLLVGIWLFSLITPDAPSAHSHEDSRGFREVLAEPRVVALLIICFLLQASHGPYYAFYSVYLEDNGYGRGLIGQLWALGVLAEVVVFMFMHKWLPKIGAARLLALSLLLTAVRWVLIGFYVENHPVMFFAQLLHAASFGLYHASAISLIHAYFPGRLQGRGQALYSSLSFGAGGAVGALASGYSWQTLGPSYVFTVASVLCLLGLGFGLRLIRLDRQR
jgi:PPP family 3-phenylpropionic acid transporter